MTKGENLWRVIEEPQSSAFVPDSVEEMSDDEVREMAMRCLPHARETVKILRRYCR